MKTLAYLAWFASAAALAFAQDGRKARTAPSAADQAALRAVDAGHEAFLNAMRANDPQALAKLAAPDAVFSPPNGAPLHGPDGLRQWFKATTDAMKVTSATVTDRSVSLAGDRAIEEGQFAISFAPPAGAPIEDRGRFMAIWQRQTDGSWKVARDIWNSSLPLPAATTAGDPWLGTWVLNVAKTRIDPGPAPLSETRTYTATPAGEKATYDMIEASGNRQYQESTYKFDRQHVPLIGNPQGETQAIWRTGPRSIAGETIRDGKVVRTATREVSADGRTLTLQFKGTNRQGQPIREETWVFDRQDAPGPRILRLTYMLVEPARVADYIKRIREHYVPIQNARVGQGRLSSWKAYQVAYPNGESVEYNFVIASEVNGFAQLEGDPTYAETAKKIAGAAKYEEVLANPIAKTIRTDTVVVRDATRNWSSAPARLLNVAFLKALPGKAADLMAIQRGHYLPATEDSVGEGGMAGWAIGVLRFPEDNSRPYSHLSIGAYESMAQMEKAASPEHRAKWGTKANEAYAKLPAVRSRVRGELWRLVEQTTAATAAKPVAALAP